MLNQCSLVLKCVTLAEVVQLVVEMLVYLAAGTIFHKEAAENTKSSHPHDLTEINKSAKVLIHLSRT